MTEKALPKDWAEKATGLTVERKHVEPRVKINRHMRRKLLKLKRLGRI